MLKHLQSGSQPGLLPNENLSRMPSKATIVGIPSLDMNYQPGFNVSPPHDVSRGSGSVPLIRHGPCGPNDSLSYHNLPQNVIYANSSVIMRHPSNLNSSIPHHINNSIIHSPTGILNSSKQSSSNNASPSTNQTKTTLMDSSNTSHHELDSTQISPINRPQQHHRSAAAPVRVPSKCNSVRNHQGAAHNTSFLPNNVSKLVSLSNEAGVKEMLTSLALLCLVSLLLAILSLVFLVKISPVTDAAFKKLNKFKFLSSNEFAILYDVTLAMCALTLSLNLCCLLVCSIQFIFSVKLLRSLQGKARSNKYLQDASATRVCAISGFFVSIPLFLTGVILYTFLHFDSTPAIITSILIGFGIVFCGAAVVHNVFVWQKDKALVISTVSSRGQNSKIHRKNSNSQNVTRNSGYGIPQAIHDLSRTSKGLELSTLV